MLTLSSRPAKPGKRQFLPPLPWRAHVDKAGIKQLSLKSRKNGKLTFLQFEPLKNNSYRISLYGVDQDIHFHPYRLQFHRVDEGDFNDSLNPKGLEDP